MCLLDKLMATHLYSASYLSTMRVRTMNLDCFMDNRRILYFENLLTSCLVLFLQPASPATLLFWWS